MSNKRMVTFDPDDPEVEKRIAKVLDPHYEDLSAFDQRGIANRARAVISALRGDDGPQDFARVVASAGREDGWVAAGQVYCGECNSNLKRGHAKGCGQRFPSYTPVS